MNEFLLKNWAVMLDSAAKVVTILAGIGLWVAYRQYKHSVNLARTNERRAAVELAARECARYGSELMKQVAELLQEIDKSGCEYVQHCKVIKDGSQVRLDTSAVTEVDKQKVKAHGAKITCVLNSLEGFAIPFTSGVADDQVGFVECGRSFVNSFEDNFSLYYTFNLQHYFKSSQALYWRWRNQIDREELERQHSQAGKDFFVLTEKLVRGKSNSRFQLALASWLRKKAEQLSKPHA